MKQRNLVSEEKSKVKNKKSKVTFFRRFGNTSVRNSMAITILTLMVSQFSGITKLYAQNADDIIDPMPIRLKAQVLSLGDESPVPFAYVLNFRTHGGVTTDEQGRFTMDMLNVDSLSISSIGFTKTTVHIPANYNEMNVLILYAKPVRFELPQVDVSGEQKKVNMEGVPIGKKMNIDPELRGDAYNKKPPVIAAVVSPASFLQYHLSKSEREKREARKAIVTEKQWEVLSQYYTKDLVIRLTGLGDSAADDFMMYINSKGLLSYMSTEYDIRNAIKEQFKIYRSEGH
ncbi:MAG: hypothetical protein WC384_22660 [Prolixibacteraceae bacterium]|jgi:hypothetical protein